MRESPEETMEQVVEETEAGEHEPAVAGDPLVLLQEAERRAEKYQLKSEEYFSQIQRLKADFDNYRRRMMQEQARWRDDAVSGVIQELLPVLDNFERALTASGGTGDVNTLRQGIEMIYRQLGDVLSRAGLEVMACAGEPFDPNRHEALIRVEADENHPPDTVVEELQRGYIYKGSVIRPAMVKVAVGGTSENEGNN